MKTERKDEKTVQITIESGVAKGVYQAITHSRIEWRKDGRLSKREWIPKAVRECAIAAGGVFQDETIVGKEGEA